MKDKLFGSSTYTTKKTTDINIKPPGPNPPASAAPVNTAAASMAAPVTTAADSAVPTPPPGAELPSAKLESKTSAGGDQTINAAMAGAIAWTVADGATVNAGDAVVKLAGYQKQEAILADATDRKPFYEKKLAKAQADNDAAKIAEAQAKIQEKVKTIADTTAELEKLEWKSPAAGKIKLEKAAGDEVKAGDEVAKISGGGGEGAAQIVATFAVGTGAKDYTPSAPCVVAAKSARDKQQACIVDTVDGDNVSVHLVPGATAAAGDEVVLLPAKK
jgi:biotin carboxyl carrier protein